MIQERVIENQALGLVCRTGRRFPSQVPRLNRLIASAMSEGRTEDRAYRVYATRRDVRFTETEYAIPREHAREALERALAADRAPAAADPVPLRGPLRRRG